MCENASSTRKYVQILPDAGHLTGLRVAHLSHLSWHHGSPTHRTARTLKSGQDPSLSAQKPLQRALNVYLQYSQRKDWYDCQLVCILLDIPDLGHWTDLAVLLLENRLTFLYPYSALVWEYDNQWRSALEVKQGLFSCQRRLWIQFFHST